MQAGVAGIYVEGEQVNQYPPLRAVTYITTYDRRSEPHFLATSRSMVEQE
jgi:hypothetical protein